MGIVGFDYPSTVLRAGLNQRVCVAFFLRHIPERSLRGVERHAHGG